MPPGQYRSGLSLFGTGRTERRRNGQTTLPVAKSFDITHKQTLPPSDSDAVLYVSECLIVNNCKYLSCKVSFNVLNYYVFILFIFAARCHA